MTTATLPESLDALGLGTLTAPSSVETTRLTIALGEYDTGWHDPKTSIAAASRLVTRVAEVGADVVVRPELATTGATTEGDRAVTLDSPDVAASQDIARAHRMWLITGIALRSTTPASSQASWCGTTSLARKAAKASRNRLCSVSK